MGACTKITPNISSSYFCYIVWISRSWSGVEKSLSNSSSRRKGLDLSLRSWWWQHQYPKARIWSRFHDIFRFSFSFPRSICSLCSLLTAPIKFECYPCNGLVLSFLCFDFPSVLGLLAYNPSLRSGVVHLCQGTIPHFLIHDSFHWKHHPRLDFFASVLNFAVFNIGSGVLFSCRLSF